MRLFGYACSAQLRGAWYSSSEERPLGLPVQPGGRHTRVRQPVEGDVVEDVVPGQLAGQLTAQDLGDQPRLAGAVAVVDGEGCEVDRRVGHAVQRLWTRRHDLGIGHVLGVELAQLLVGAQLVGTQAGRRRVAELDGRVDLGRRRARHVRMDAGELGCGLGTHHLRDGRAPVAALCDEAVVSEPLHQLDPGAPDPWGIPPGLGRLRREPVAWQRWNHEMERVRGVRALRGWVREGLDDLQLLDDRPRPAVGHDQRQRVPVPGADMQEVGVQPGDLGEEVRQGVERCLAPPPVVRGPPVPHEVLHQRQGHALGVVGDGLTLRPPRRRDPAAEVVERLLRNIDVEGADVGTGPCLL
jgi:hypothetical protein